MNKLTIVFYENPAALHEIKAWENLKWNEIRSKIKHKDNKILYKLSYFRHQCHVNETLICIDNDNLYMTKDDISANLALGECSYYDDIKFLFFGNFNLRKIDYAKKCMTKLLEANICAHNSFKEEMA